MEFLFARFATQFRQLARILMYDTVADVTFFHALEFPI